MIIESYVRNVVLDNKKKYNLFLKLYFCTYLVSLHTLKSLTLCLPLNYCTSVSEILLPLLKYMDMKCVFVYQALDTTTPE